MKHYSTSQVRNVGLFSHGGAGKTTLAEALACNAGATTRLGRVDEGNTLSDFDPEEIRRKMSVSTSVLPFEWRDCKINLLDTPGYADFAGEVKSAMRVVDAAIILLDAVAGVELGAERVWRYADEQSLPRLIVVNRVDRENANFDNAVDQARSMLGQRCIPIQLPIGVEQRFSGIVDLVEMRALVGPNLEVAEIPGELRDAAAAARERLVESICETDDELITKYLEGEELTNDEVRAALGRAVRDGQATPVLVCSALQNKAVKPILDVIVDYAPSPVDHGPVRATRPQTGETAPLDPNPDGPLAAYAFKTRVDPHVGKLTYLRVYSGTLRSDSHVWNAVKGRDERIGQLLSTRGKNQEPVGQIAAGDVGAIAKLAETSTGDTLSSKEHPLVLDRVAYPEPLFSVALHPKTRTDLDKLGPALQRIADEDPTLRVNRDVETAETVLSGMGEAHIEAAVEKMKRLGVEVTTSIPRVPYRETVTQKITSEYKHKKQTGGHGQYGHVFLEIEPLPRGTGFEFGERVVGGVVPKQFIPAVEKGVQEALHEGVLAHYPVTDVKVVLYDGSYHDVDSNEMSFKLAASQAFKKGVEKGSPVLLEPIMQVEVIMPDQFVGDVMSSVTTHRGRVLGMTPQDGKTRVEAQVPLAEMLRYSTDLRSITQGRGVYSMQPMHYEEVPPHVAQQIIATAQREREQKEKE